MIFFFPVLVRLGFWQLERAEQKQQALAVYQQQQDLPAVPIETLTAEQRQAYRNVSVSGFFDEQHYWLLDNQARGGKTGYELLMPLVSNVGIILVNRGWLQAPLTRNRLPEFNTPEGEVNIRGYLYPATENAIFKQTISDLDVNWPKRVLQIDIPEAIESLPKVGESVGENTRKNNENKFILRIDESSPGALITAWPVINTKPEKHTAYAIQWFAMALALVILYVWFLYRSRHQND